MCCERYQSEGLWVKLQALNTALADQTRTSKPGTTPQAAAQTMYPPGLTMLLCVSRPFCQACDVSCG